MIDGLPYAFFLPLVVHALAGLTTAMLGIVAFSVPKGPTRHHRWGERYLWAYTILFLTATILSAQRWAADAYLFALAVLGYGFALCGYSARRFRQAPWLLRTLGEYWVIAHLTGMIASYVMLWTAFYVDNAHLIPGLNRLPTLTFADPHILGSACTHRAAVPGALHLVLSPENTPLDDRGRTPRHTKCAPGA
jgi:hypothetical protein